MTPPTRLLPTPSNLTRSPSTVPHRPARSRRPTSTGRLAAAPFSVPRSSRAERRTSTPPMLQPRDRSIRIAPHDLGAHPTQKEASALPSTSPSWRYSWTARSKAESSRGSSAPPTRNRACAIRPRATARSASASSSSRSPRSSSEGSLPNVASSYRSTAGDRLTTLEHRHAARCIALRPRVGGATTRTRPGSARQGRR